jgi:hypothetical protein
MVMNFSCVDAVSLPDAVLSTSESDLVSDLASLNF